MLTIFSEILKELKRKRVYRERTVEEIKSCNISVDVFIKCPEVIKLEDEKISDGNYITKEIYIKPAEYHFCIYVPRNKKYDSDDDYYIEKAKEDPEYKRYMNEFNKIKNGRVYSIDHIIGLHNDVKVENVKMLFEE